MLRLFGFVLMFLLFGGQTFAAVPYESYVYDYWRNPVLTPHAYLPELILDGYDLGIGPLNAPMDLFATSDGRLFVLDSGNNRIVVLKDWEVIRVIDDFQNGEELDTFDSPEGLFVTPDDALYVADTGNRRIVELRTSGELVRVVPQPQATILPEDFLYQPIAIAVDGARRMFVISEGANQGIIELDDEGGFVGFLGAPLVTPNLIDFFWRRIASEEQRARMEIFVPTEYNNIEIDAEGFLYVTTSALDSNEIMSAVINRNPDARVSPIRRLNPTGQDVLRRRGYFPPVGDLYAPIEGTFRGPSSIVDVTVGNDGVYSLLDSRRGRVFTYDYDGNLLYVFGGMGVQAGTFQTPRAIEHIGNRLIVLDQGTSRINVFGLTEYGGRVRSAVRNYYLGRFEQSADDWRQVSELFKHSSMAYVGLGKALFRQEEYETAMTYFELAEDRDNYSRAFAEYRKERVGSRFGLIVGVIVAAVVLLQFGLYARKKLGESST